MIMSVSIDDSSYGTGGIYTRYGEIDSAVDMIFLLEYIYKRSLLIIILHEEDVYKFVQFYDIAKNWHFCNLSS